MKKHKPYWVLAAVAGLTLMAGCSGGTGGADFDLGKFFGNPIVIFLVLILVVGAWLNNRKGR